MDFLMRFVFLPPSVLSFDIATLFSYIATSVFLYRHIVFLYCYIVFLYRYICFPISLHLFSYIATSVFNVDYLFLNQNGYPSVVLQKRYFRQ
jgi:hypothetical protein